MDNNRRWLCLDCGKNTLKGNDDYYFLKDRLWRQLVPRDQRHGMICRPCIERRLGRPLASEDFKRETDDQAEDQPMKEEDYKWSRVDLDRQVAWLDHGTMKSGDGRGIPLNADAVAALESTRGQHPRWCFTFVGKRIHQSSTAWDKAKQRAGIEDFRFHDLRHTGPRGTCRAALRYRS
jgi:hypothetical protein